MHLFLLHHKPLKVSSMRTNKKMNTCKIQCKFKCKYWPDRELPWGRFVLSLVCASACCLFREVHYDGSSTLPCFLRVSWLKKNPVGNNQCHICGYQLFLCARLKRAFHTSYDSSSTQNECRLLNAKKNLRRLQKI